MLASTYPAYPGDGTPGFVRDLAHAEAEDFDTLVVVPRVRGAQAQETDGGVRVHRYGYFPQRWEDLADGAIIENLRANRLRWLQVIPFLVAQAVQVRRAAHSFQPDVVHAHWIIPQGIIARLVLGKTPTLLTTLGGDLYALNSSPLRLVKGFVVRHARKITVMNNDMRARVLDLGASENDVEVVPMGFDSRAVQVRKERSEGVAISILFVGRLVEKKGLGRLLGALHQLPAHTASLRVVGDGPLRDAMREQATGLDVDFLGQLGRGDLYAEYSRADIAVFPSVSARSGDQDGLPVALLEAMAAGCAIVASDIPGINEVIEDRVSGLLVRSGSEPELGSAITRLISDPSMRTRLGRAAVERAQQYSITEVGRRYRALLHHIRNAG